MHILLSVGIDKIEKLNVLMNFSTSGQLSVYPSFILVAMNIPTLTSEGDDYTPLWLWCNYNHIMAAIYGYGETIQP